MKIATTSLLLILLLTGCKSKHQGPVPIETEDTCAMCRMAISERQYAAELIDRNGTLYKFDDIACMLRFVHAHAIQIPTAHFYVTDYKTGKDWLDARRSYFAGLRTSVSSPMGSGIVAFRNAGDAEQVAGNKFGRVLTFEELLAKNIDSLGANIEALPVAK